MTPPTKPQSVTSALWIVVLLNALFRDLHAFPAPGAPDRPRFNRKGNRSSDRQT